MFQKEIEGRKLLKAHLEKKAAAEAASSSSSSSSLEKTPGGLKNPEQHSVTSPDACTYAPPRRSQSVATDGALPAKQNTRISIESGPIVAPTPHKVVPALGKEHVSSLKLKIDRATPVTSRSLSVDKAATLTTSSSLVNKAIPAPSESPAARVAKAAKPIPAPLK
jgi:hypothetical protein